MARGKRGGTRTPEPPKLVKGTGAPTQPAKPPTVAPGNAYGERQALETQAAAAPMYDDQQPAGGPPQMPLGSMPDAFAPTNRPNESATAGLGGQNGGYTDPVEVLRAIYRSYPSPWIAALLGDNY